MMHALPVAVSERVTSEVRLQDKVQALRSAASYPERPADVETITMQRLGSG